MKFDDCTSKTFEKIFSVVFPEMTATLECPSECERDNTSFNGC
jgi:hypothetical protein